LNSHFTLCDLTAAIDWRRIAEALVEPSALKKDLHSGGAGTQWRAVLDARRSTLEMEGVR
jgi:hypothetical protein